MTRTYDNSGVTAPIAKARQAIEGLKNDQRLDSNFRRDEIDRLKREANGQARAAYQAQQARIKADQEAARKSVYKSLVEAEKGLNWGRMQYLHQVITTSAGHADGWDQLRDAFTQAVEGGDLEAARAWHDALPAVRDATRNLPDHMKNFPTLAIAVRQGFEALEPAPVQVAREILQETDQAAEAFERECQTASFTSWGLDSQGFLADRPMIFGEN